MNALQVTEIKAFVPAQDFEQSKRFYQALGFTLASDEDGIAYFHLGNASFLLQDFHVAEHSANFMMHLLVNDVQAWWQHVQDCGVTRMDGVKVTAIETQPWGMRDFCLIDPTGVLWRIGQNVTPT